MGSFSEGEAGCLGQNSGLLFPKPKHQAKGTTKGPLRVHPEVP